MKLKQDVKTAEENRKKRFCLLISEFLIYLEFVF